MTERTFVIYKPDCVRRGLLGLVMQRIERTGLRLVGSKVSVLSDAILAEHYAHIVQKPFYPRVSTYMQSCPVLMQVREGDNAVSVVRKLVGVTNPVDADPGTIRGDYALSIDANVIHASEDIDAAQTEIARFFATHELVA